MKAKTILRISLFAALLCMITMLGAFAAEDTAKIFRFDGNGTLPTGITAITDSDVLDDYEHFVTSDGTYRIELHKKHLAYLNDDNSFKSYTTIHPNLNLPGFGAEYDFKLSEYPYVKLKYKTNYPATMQFYISVPYTTTNEKGETITKTSYIYFQHNDVGTSSKSAWQTKEFYYGAVNNEITDKNQGTIVYNNATLNFTAGIKEQYHFASSDNEIYVGNNHKPFFQFKNITETQYNALTDNEVIFIEIEYLAFFKTEEEMEAYEGNPSNSKILAWDGSENIAFATPTSQSVSGEKKEWFSITDDGHFRVDMKKEDLNNPILHEGVKKTTDIDGNAVYDYSKSAGYTTFQPTFEFQDLFKSTEYPYVKLKYKTNFPKTMQFYNTKSNYLTYFPDDTRNGIEAVLKVDNSNKSEADVRAMFQFKGYNTDTNKDGKADTLATEDYYVELYYIAYFDKSEEMNAYGTDEYNKVNKVISELLTNVADGGASSYLNYTMHPATVESDVADYVESVVTSIDDTVGVSCDMDEYNDKDSTYYKVWVTITAGTGDSKYSKTVAVNVKINHLADITPTVKGAQTRTDDSGLRFGFTYNHKLDTTGYDEISYGALIVPENLIGENAITLENVDKVLLDGEQIIANVPKVYNLEVNDDEKYTLYTAVVTDFGVEDSTTYNKKCEVKFVAVPYVTYKVGDDTFTVYGDKITRSIEQVKDKINIWSTDAE